MRKLGIQDFLILTLVLLLIAGSKQDAFIKADIEFKNEYFALCDSVMTDTREISEQKAYEMSKKLQSDDCAHRLKKLKELLNVMEQNQEIKDIYSSIYEARSSDYNEIIFIKESYSKWDQLTEDQIFEIVSDYGVINTMYSMERDDRSN